ncbi:MAG TPA: 8-oxo-dGTP diphosphatase [Chthoniobacteraceae bacterium]|jgi:8-oxo-dGTP diphosphatase
MANSSERLPEDAAGYSPHPVVLLLLIMPFTNWTPRERANLCFIIKDGKLLLIRKKRGLGAGKINGPGGKIDPGETALESAIRETQEEIGVTPTGVEKRGELRFQFADGYSLHCTVFTATGYTGEIIETAEAIPFWVSTDEIPYDEMWEDDRHWLPLMLEGKSFSGSFTFDGETMLTKEVEVGDAVVR